ncbi:MAG TPA: alpha/beta fold hydrolase [Trebonia sp.]
MDDVRGEKLNDGLSAATAGQGPPLVWLPGLGQGADLSEAVPRAEARTIARLAAGLNRTVHLIHRPLRPPPEMTIARLATWHATALRERFGEPVDVMGVSGGGITALQLALDHPDVVRRLILCVAAAQVSDEGLHGFTRMVELEADGRTTDRIATAWTGSRLIAHGPLRLLLLALFAVSPGPPRAPGEAALVAAAQTWDVTGRLAEISMPTLVAGGTRDRVFPAALTRSTAAGVPGARLLLLRGRGHASAMMDRRLNPAIAAFLAETDPRAAPGARTKPGTRDSGAGPG